MIALRVHDKLVRVRYPCVVVRRSDGSDVMVAPVTTLVEETGFGLFVVVNMHMWGVLFTDCNISTYTANTPARAAYGFRPERVSTYRIIEACAAFSMAPIVDKVIYSTRSRVNAAYHDAYWTVGRLSMFELVWRSRFRQEKNYAERLTYISNVPMIGELYDTKKSKRKARRGS